MWQELAGLAARAAGAPLVTWYAPGARIELSAKTLANAVAKAANLLDEHCDVTQGSTVHVSLGSHWQSSVWQCAALVCGATLGPPAAGQWTVAAQPVVPGERLAVIGPDPFGMPTAHVQADALDAAREVRAMPDALMIAPTSGQWAVSDGPTRVSPQQLRDMAHAQSPLADARIAVVGHGTVLSQALWHVAVPVLTGAAVVLSETPLTSHVIAQERISQVVDLTASVG